MTGATTALSRAICPKQNKRSVRLAVNLLVVPKYVPKIVHHGGAAVQLGNVAGMLPLYVRISLGNISNRNHDGAGRHLIRTWVRNETVGDCSPRIAVCGWDQFNGARRNVGSDEIKPSASRIRLSRWIEDPGTCDRLNFVGSQPFVPASPHLAAFGYPASRSTAAVTVWWPPPRITPRTGLMSP